MPVEVSRAPQRRRNRGGGGFAQGRGVTRLTGLQGRQRRRPVLHEKGRGRGAGDICRGRDAERVVTLDAVPGHGGSDVRMESAIIPSRAGRRLVAIHAVEFADIGHCSPSDGGGRGECRRVVHGL